MPSPQGILKRRRRAGRTRGQSLVEFALIFPLFFTLFLGIIEFAFAFNAILAVNFASRNAALAAAEAGTNVGGDCVILQSIEDDISAPADTSRITKIEVYRAKSNGDDYTPAEITTLHPDGLAHLHDARREQRDRPVHADPQRLSRGEPLQHPRRLRRDPHDDRPHRGPDLLHAHAT